MTEQEKQKLKDALIEHKNIATSEYDDEDAFVGIYFSDLVDIIDSVMDNTGWHPASEPPKEDGEYVVFCYGFDLPFKAKYSEYINEWSHRDVKWWCYPPKED
jgi:hypothetical protein